MRRRLHSTEPGKMLRSECEPIRSHPGDVGCNGGMQTRSGAELGQIPSVRQGCRGDEVSHGEPNVAKLTVRPCHAPLPVRLLKVYVGIDRRRPTLPMLSRRA